jgi:hypothetical protein
MFDHAKFLTMGDTQIAAPRTIVECGPNAAVALRAPARECLTPPPRSRVETQSAHEMRQLAMVLDATEPPRTEINTLLRLRVRSTNLSARCVGHVAHQLLVESAPEEATQPGDSGSPVMSEPDGGVLLGMRIAAMNNGPGTRFIYMIPAWQLLDPATSMGVCWVNCGSCSIHDRLAGARGSGEVAPSSMNA